MSDYILSFDEISARDLPRVGGKGANLGEMTRAGFPVPPGFCVTTTAFTRFLDAAGADAIWAQLEPLAPDDVEGVRRVGAAIRSQLAAVPIPADVAQAVAEAWQAQDPQQTYAVRSSATAEDLPDASFAGQQDTFLNVRGQEALLARVRDCWISLFTDRAILYRAQNDFAHRDVQLAVVVQRMVIPEVAGTLFTADPVTNHRQILSIDASYGLGEALVAGLVTPDLYTVDKRRHAIVKVQVGEKQLAIRPAAGGGTVREAIEGAARTARVLDDAQVLELAALGTRVESHYGAPQDIEWAWAEGRFYLLQTRPITSLFPLPAPRPQDDALHVYFSLSHAQVMTDPMPPMALSFWRLVFPFGKRGNREVDNPYMAAAAGRLYLDITPLLLMPRIGKLLPRLLGTLADALSAGALREVMSRPGFDRDAGRRRARFRTFFGWIAPLYGRALARLLWHAPEGAAAELSAHMDAYVARVAAQLAAAAPGVPRLRLARRLLSTVLAETLAKMAPYVAAGIQAKMQLALWGRHLGMPEEAEAVVRGLSGNVTTEMDLAVGDLADVARRSPALVEHLRSHEPEVALATAGAVPGGQEFLAAWSRFIAAYGMRGPSEIDISRPGWAEAPASLMQVVVSTLQNGEPGVHRLRHAALAAEGEAAAKRLVAAASRGPLGRVRSRIRGRIVGRMARVARNLLAVREHPKYLLMRVRGLLRPALLEAGAMLQAQGRIDQVEDIWLLDLAELITALEYPNQELRSRLAVRRRDQERYWTLTPPRVITSEGEIITAQHQHANLPEGALAGTPVSAGVIEGPARVVVDPETERLQPGEILVAPFTDPGWTPLFINASGLVMETGGLMTHGSVVAREYGIPAVVAVPDATHKIRTGQRIRVHGTDGYVEILENGAVLLE